MKMSVSFLLCILLCAFSTKAQWALTGNAGTSATTNFLGTKDFKPLRFRVNNIWAGELNPITGNVFIGLHTGISDTSGRSNIAIGTDALKLNTFHSYLVAIGDSALFNNTYGYANTAIGSKVLYTNDVGNANTAAGFQSMYSNGGGNSNTAYGYYALRSNVHGNNNTATGVSSMQANLNGSDNTAYGVLSLLTNTTGSYNDCFGSGVMFYNATGSYNVALGSESMLSNTYGSHNVAVGSNALLRTSGSQYNTAVGFNAAIAYNLGYNNTILGANCDAAFDGVYNDISIGQGVTCTDNSMARIGNSATWSIGGYAGWSNLSDGRYKKDITENVQGLAFIMKLRPITYHLDVTSLSKRLKENHGEAWNTQMKKAMADKEKVLLTGFVAQEVEQAAKETGFDFSGVDKPRNDSGVYALRYAEFVVPLVKAMQEQQQLIIDLQRKVQLLQDQADITILLRETFPADKIGAYPDPVANNMTVTINTQTTGNGTLQLFDSDGKLIKQMNIVVQQGNNSINLSLPMLAAGYYTIKMDWGSTMHKQLRFVKAGN